MSQCLFWGGLQGLGLDRQSVNPLRDHIAQGIIHKAVTLNVCQSVEAAAAQMHRKMASLAGTGMAGVQVAVVGDLNGFELQGLTQGGFDQGGGDTTRGGALLWLLCCATHCDTPASALLSFWAGGMWRARYTPCASVNTSIRPMPPHILKFTQVLSEKL